jgi:hypothetical protein
MTGDQQDADAAGRDAMHHAVVRFRFTSMKTAERFDVHLPSGFSSISMGCVSSCVTTILEGLGARSVIPRSRAVAFREEFAGDDVGGLGDLRDQMLVAPKLPTLVAGDHPRDIDDGFVSIMNTSTEPRAVTVTLFGAARPSRVIRDVIQPRSTKLVRIDDLIADSRATPGGLRISFAGTPGDIVAEDAVVGKSTGFAKRIRFVDRTLMFKEQSLRTNFVLLAQQPASWRFPAAACFVQWPHC